MKIGVIIPIIHDKFINGLLECIEQNSVTPDKIIVIDNSQNHVKLLRHLDIEHYTPPSPFGVNASWNYGIHELHSQVDLISVLNDDLLIEKLFFEKLANCAINKQFSKASVFCPETVNASELCKSGNELPIASTIGVVMGRREGWAWTIRSNMARIIPPIPDELKTWCGDDWYWHQCQSRGHYWIKMLNNRCFHYIGQSNRIADVHKNIKKEKQMLRASLGSGLPIRSLDGRRY